MEVNSVHSVTNCALSLFLTFQICSIYQSHYRLSSNTVSFGLLCTSTTLTVPTRTKRGQDPRPQSCIGLPQPYSYYYCYRCSIKVCKSNHNTIYHIIIIFAWWAGRWKTLRTSLPIFTYVRGFSGLVQMTAVTWSCCTCKTSSQLLHLLTGKERSFPREDYIYMLIVYSKLMAGVSSRLQHPWQLLGVSCTNRPVWPPREQPSISFNLWNLIFHILSFLHISHRRPIPSPSSKAWVHTATLFSRDMH